MYEQFYKFSGKPFQLNPDPRFFFRSVGHQRAMAYLRYGLQQGQGFIVVTGDVGTGKSMLVSNLFRELDKDRVEAVKVVSTNVDDKDLLTLVAADLELPFSGLTKAELLKSIERHCRSCREEGRRVLLVIDESQNLPRGSLEELRMLSNFEFEGQPLIQSFLLGQREFRNILRGPGLEQLRQRVIAAYHLKPLSEAETRKYVQHRLKTVGWNNDPTIADEVYQGIYQFTRGIPRKVNTLCDRLLLHGALEELHDLTGVQLRTVTQEIDVEQGDPGTDEHIAADSGEARSRGGEPPPREPSRRDEDLHRLESRLLAMQRTMDHLAEKLGRGTAEPPRPPDIEPVDMTPPPPGLSRPSERRWTIAFSVTVFVLCTFVLVAYYYFNGRI